MALLYSACSGAVRWSGGLTVLKAGQSISADHPLVAERPDLFTDAEPEPDIKMPAKPGRGGPIAPPVVETATRAPGEARQTPAAPARQASGRKASTSKPSTRKAATGRRRKAQALVQDQGQGQAERQTEDRGQGEDGAGE